MLLCTLLYGLPIALAGNLTSSKRGLVYTWSDGYSDGLWDQSESDLTWYYNYASTPVSSFNSRLSFVPMLWGTGPQYNSFYSTVKGLLGSGSNIDYILAFNEPDLCGPASEGGSCVGAQHAAQIWQSEIEPLKQQHGLQLGAPAVTQGGAWWLQDFFEACAGKCTIDFLPLHYYGDFVGLAAYLGAVHATYPQLPLWLTEFAEPNVTVLGAQQFYNQSVAFLDALDYLARYAYFGSFPADDASSWVGPNGSMLDDGGRLTDIGAWYLGFNATGRGPESGGVVVPGVTWISLLAFVVVWSAVFCFG